MDAAGPFSHKTRVPNPPCFSCPEEVLESLSLERKEKRRILLQWLEDEKALLVADDEGMEGNRPPQIEQVQQALRALEE